MATKAKEASVVGKEKKAQSSNSPITTTKRPIAKPSATDRPKSSPSSEKPVPNYLKPTISSVRLESHSFKLPRSDATTKPIIDRRRSFDKPPSPSRLPKQTHPSLSRQHKALVSPGPRDRAQLLRPSSAVIKSTNPPKPIPERLSKTPKEGKTEPKSVKKSSPSVTTSNANKKLITGDASSKSKSATNNGVGSSNAETNEAIRVETEPEVKEAINEPEKVENNQEHVVEDVSENIVENENEHVHEHDQKVEETNEPHVEAMDEKKVIPTEEEEEAKEEVIEEKHTEDDSTNQDECNIDESHPEIDHSTIEEQVEVKEKEEELEEEGGVIIEEDNKNEGEVVVEEDHESETKNEEIVEEEKEEVEEKISEEVNKLSKGEGEEEQVKEEKEESTKPKQQEVQGNKKESPSKVSNDVIEETASKLLEERRNKVRALAGAFQTVIDHQTK